MSKLTPDKGIIVTRPIGYNEDLARLLCDEGYRVLERPLLSIKPLNFSHRMKHKVMKLDTYDAVIFVSRNAVNCSLRYLRDLWPQWPTELIWCAVGKKTAEDLSFFSVQTNYPEEQGANGLIDIIDWRDIKKVLIVRGKGGLENLRERLQSRRIKVDYLEVYERVPKHYSMLEQEIVELHFEVIVLTSGDALKSLCASVGPEVRAKLIVLVPTERIGELVRQSGIKKLVVTGGVNNKDILNSLASIKNGLDYDR